MAFGPASRQRANPPGEQGRPALHPALLVLSLPSRQRDQPDRAADATRSLKTTLPLRRVKPKDLDTAGVVRLPRTIAVRDGRPVMEDGQIVDVANVVWATGYRPAFDWVHLDVFDQEGQPVHDRGVLPSLVSISSDCSFSARLASSLVGGVGRDAEYIARHIAGRRSASVRAHVRGLEGCAKLIPGPCVVPGGQPP